MNMSEDVTAVSMQVSEKAAEVALSAFKSVLDSVGRLFRELLGMEHDRARARAQMKAAKSGSQAPDKTKPPNVSATNLTGIKPGEVSLKDLAENARNTGEALSVAQNGFSQEDRKAIARTAKKYGIPVAFSNTKGKNNLYANVRSGDLPIFKQICTECVKEKIAAKPETLGNFKVQPWEVPHLTAMLKAHDLPAVFVETKSGDQYCLHDVKHQDAVRIVREEFVAKCKEIEKQFSFDKDENGFYTLKDLHSGREVSFDQIPDKATVSKQIQSQFGYDPVKADLAAAKFGEEALKGKQKERYFSGSAQNEFSRIESNVTLEGESLHAKPFGCWYVQPKKDEKPRVVFRDQSGKYAVLEPQNMTRAKMRSLLTEQLGITDRRTLDALTDKADRVTDFYARQDTKLLTAEKSFQIEDFELEKIIEHKYTGASGTEYVTKQKPLDSVENSIQRTGKDSFTVNTVFRSTEITDKGESIPHEQTEKLDFTLSDKKRTLHFLSAMYMDAGMSEADAKSMAKEVYSKAEAQSPETVLRIEEVRQNSMTVAYGKASVVLSTADRQEAAEKIAGLGVSPQTAETLVEKAQEIRVDAVKERVAAVQAQQTDFNTAMNHLTDREERAIDTMIVCSAAEPQKHIVVEGGHNGSRVVHDYTVRDGGKQLAAFTDAETTDENGKPVRTEKGTTAWTALKGDMLDASGMDKDSVLTFRSQEEYEQYLADTDMLREANEMPDADDLTDAAAIGNGHELHPDGNVLDELHKEFPVWASHTPICTVNELKSDPDSEHFEYDGSGYLIENLDAPLFETVSGAVIKNVNIRNSAIVSDKYKDYGFLVCTAYNYHYLAEDEQVYETGETVIEHCSVSHSSITVKLPESELNESEPAVTTMEVVPPDVIEYDEKGNIIELDEEPAEPTKHAEHCIGAITGIGGQIDGCYVTDFGIFNELPDYYLYCGGISGKPAAVTDSAVYYYSAQGNIFNAGGVVGSAAGARAYDAKGRELPDCYGGSIQGCLARNIILKTETAAGGIAAEGTTDAEGALISNCYCNELDFSCGEFKDAERVECIKAGTVGGIIAEDGSSHNGHTIMNCVSRADFKVIGQKTRSSFDDTVRLAPAYAYYQENILTVLNKNTVSPVNPKEIYTGSFMFGENGVFGDDQGSLAYPEKISDLLVKTIAEENNE